MLNARAQAVMQEYLKQVVANTIRREPGVSYAVLPDAAVGFPIDDKVYAMFIDLVVNKSQLLPRINMVTGLNRLQGDILRHDLDEFILKRTNVDTTTERKPSIVSSSTPELFNLLRAEWDFRITYDELGQWSYRGAAWLSNMIADQAATTYGNNLQWVGFQGTSDGNPPAAADLTDFSIGWLQLLRAFNAAAQFMSEVVAGSGVITVGPKKVLTFDGAASDQGGGVVGLPCTAHGRPTGSQIVITGTTNYNGAFLVLASSTADQIDITSAYNAEDVTGKTATHTPDYTNLHQLAADLRNSITPQLRNGLVTVVSDELRGSEEELVLAAAGREPLQERAMQQLVINQIAGMEQVVPYGIPAGTMVVTNPYNLAIYMHETMHRRIEDEPRWNGYVFWNDTHLDYIITDYRRIMAAENIAVCGS